MPRKHYIPCHPEGNPAVYTLQCPYCPQIVTSRVSQARLPEALKRHMRARHPEILAAERAALPVTVASDTDGLKELPVTCTAYTRQTLKKHYPPLKTARVPVKWRCEVVHCKVTGSGEYIVYPPGRVGRLEWGWKVGG